MMAEEPCNTSHPPGMRSPKLSGRYRGSVGDFCCVPGCSNSRGRCKRKGLIVSFYRFPKDRKRADMWLKRIRRDEICDGKVVPYELKNHSRICSVHFVGGKKVDDPNDQAYVPTIFPRNSAVKRTTQRSKQAELYTPSPQTVKKTPKVAKSSSGRPSSSIRLNFNKDCENAVWNGDHDYVIGAKSTLPDMESVEDLKRENEMVKSKQLRLINIKDNPEKFQFYTNLPNYEVFKALCNYLQKRIPGGNLKYWKGQSTSTSSSSKRGPERKLSFEEEIFIVLVKLKTGNFNEDLAMTFDISATHISSIFSTHINFLANELRILFEMQYSEEGQAECFEDFENLRVVLVCTELMAQRSSNLDVRKKTFSNYKHYDSAKFLVGISPNLTVNFVSRAWGGRATDKKITLSSDGIMNNLKSGDAVMADRGFNIASELKKKGVDLLIPNFKGRDRAQISAEEAKRSEYISKARIHVERVIQRIKTFYFLERTIRLNMQDIITQVFIVCAYLTNFQMPIIKK